MRTVLYHDYFAIRGGGERLVLTLAQAIEARLVYGYRSRDSYADEHFPTDVKSLEVEEWLRQPKIRVPALAWAFARCRKEAALYDIRVFSGVAAPFAAPNRGSGTNIYYCHTPPRFLYDQHEFLLRREGATRRPVLRAAMRVFEQKFVEAMNRMDVIVANSETTRQRVQTYLGRDSVVIYPPIATGNYSARSQSGDYYLSNARLTPLKRVDSIIRAFLDMPEKKLVVVSDGDEGKALRALAGNAPNIEFRGWIDDETLSSLMGRAIATIYVPKDEDFGMSPLESMAAGKPVIGVAEGGVRETVLHGRTGTLLAPDFSVADLAAAVRAMTPELAASMRAACVQRAAEFDESHFITRMKSLFDDLAPGAAPRTLGGWSGNADLPAA